MSGARRRLRILAWPGMPAPAALAEAGRRLGVAVEADVVSSNERLEALLDEREADGGEGAYDLICPSDYLVQRLRAGGRLLALEREVLALDRLSDWALAAAHDEGCRVSVPLAFGTTGYLCDARAPDPGSWSALFAPQGGARVGMLDEPREVVGAALLALGMSPNATGAEELRAARALLERQRPSVARYDSDDFVGPVADGRVRAHQAWSGPAAAAVRRDAGLRYAVPAEGAVLWVTTAAIPASARDPEASHRLLAELLDPELAAVTTATQGFATPNEQARRRLAPAVRDDPSLFPDARTLGRCHALADLGDHERAILDVFAVATGRGPCARARGAVQPP
ncbi:MAG TPA: spermidine/putrescine ABC transporter substrate-binding protein [Solirubrobacteraceae bacterium]